MTFFDLRTVDERWWAKYFQQSAQSNFIHKFLRQGKLQLTLGPGGSVAQNQSENIWQSRNQKFVLRNLDLQKPPSWDKTLKSGGNLKLRLGLDQHWQRWDPSLLDRAECSSIQTNLGQLWQAFLCPIINYHLTRYFSIQLSHAKDTFTEECTVATNNLAKTFSLRKKEKVSFDQTLSPEPFQLQDICLLESLLVCTGLMPK